MNNMWKKLKKYISNNRISISRLLVLLGGAIIIWFLYRGIFIEKFINPKTTISLDRASKIGDFIGGFAGVFFTLVGIVLLYETLSLQRKELKESRNVFEKQQFENTFFSMIELYNNLLNAIHTDKDYTTGETFSGKDFFFMQKQELHFLYQPQLSFYKNVKEAKNVYINFYLENIELVSQYFRILYRIFRTIEQSGFNFKEQMFYAKIIRAQLSISELFFIKYNSSINEGKRFQLLIKKYNILKHLPLLELLEYKGWKSQLTQEKENSINHVLTEIRDYIKNKLEGKGKDKFYKTYLTGKYAITIELKKSSIEMYIYINNKVTYPNNIQEGYGLDDFNNEELERLLKFFFSYLFKGSDVNKLITNNKVIIKTDIIENEKENDKFVISVIAKTKNNEPLKI